MSRSFKKPVSNARFIWHSICCINHGAMPKWRAAGHRWHRRYNKRLLRLYEKTFDNFVYRCSCYNYIFYSSYN